MRGCVGGVEASQDGAAVSVEARAMSARWCESQWGGHICHQLDEHDGVHTCGEPSDGNPCTATWSDGQASRR